MVIFTDIIGGAPFRQAALLASSRENLDVVYGTTLHMLVEAVLEKDHCGDVRKLVADLLPAARDGIGSLSDIHAQTATPTRKQKKDCNHARKNLTLNNPSGLHARPAKDFVQLAKGFEASVTIVKDGNEYNGKSLMKLLQAGLSKGDQLVLKTDGADEADALAKLADYITNLAE